MEFTFNEAIRALNNEETKPSVREKILRFIRDRETEYASSLELDMPIGYHARLNIVNIVFEQSANHHYNAHFMFRPILYADKSDKTAFRVKFPHGDSLKIELNISVLNDADINALTTVVDYVKKWDPFDFNVYVDLTEENLGEEK